MNEGLSRRELLGWGVGVGAAALACRPLLATESLPQVTSRLVDPTLAAAFEALDAFVPRHLEEQGLPGLTHALASREGTLRTATYGFRDVKTRKSLTTDDVFEIGSITKSFVALCVLQLREEGKLDLDRPQLFISIRKIYAFHLHRVAFLQFLGQLHPQPVTVDQELRHRQRPDDLRHHRLLVFEFYFLQADSQPKGELVGGALTN